MHPVLLILLSWLAVDAAVVSMALVSAHHRSRRLGAYRAELLERAELHADR
jgi:membrane protein required for beta-lactamase induction